MTAENIYGIINKYKKRIPKDSVDSVRSSLEYLPDDCAQSLTKTPMKSCTLVVLLSFFFGGLSADRFYLGDYILGIVKLAFTALIVGLRLLIFFVDSPTMEIVLIITNILHVVLIVWCIADIYYTWKAARVYNLSKLTYSIGLMGKNV